MSVSREKAHANKEMSAWVVHVPSRTREDPSQSTAPPAELGESKTKDRSDVGYVEVGRLPLTETDKNIVGVAKQDSQTAISIVTSPFKPAKNAMKPMQLVVDRLQKATKLLWGRFMRMFRVYEYEKSEHVAWCPAVFQQQTGAKMHVLVACNISPSAPTNVIHNLITYLQRKLGKADLLRYDVSLTVCGYHENYSFAAPYMFQEEKMQLQRNSYQFIITTSKGDAVCIKVGGDIGIDLGDVFIKLKKDPHALTPCGDM